MDTEGSRSFIPWVRAVHCTGWDVQVTVTQGQTRIPALVGQASEADVTVTSVDLQTPSLEAGFLAHTGRTIDDTGTETGPATPEVVMEQ